MEREREEIKREERQREERERRERSRMITSTEKTTTPTPERQKSYISPPLTTGGSRTHPTNGNP